MPWDVIEKAAEILGWWLAAGVVVVFFCWVIQPFRPNDVEPRMVSPQDWSRR